MTEWLEQIVREEPVLLPGHGACAGCGPAINVRHVLGALRSARPDSPIVLVIPASCWTIIAGVYPVSAFDVAVHLTPFASAAAEAAGITAGLRLRGVRDAMVVVWAGDGATADIGFSGVSAAAERNEDLIYVLNDNEAYMNTGVQKSGATPEGAWTTTTPERAPRAGQKKDIFRIMAAHGIPYLATLAAGSTPMLRDFRAKVAKAAAVEGFRFLHVLGPCPPGWKYSTDQSVELARLAVESRYFPLLEFEHGNCRITYRPKHHVEVLEFLAAQGRFAHLTPAAIASIQAHVDARWNSLAGIAAEPTAVIAEPASERRGASERGAAGSDDGFVRHRPRGVTASSRAIAGPRAQ